MIPNQDFRNYLASGLVCQSLWDSTPKPIPTLAAKQTWYKGTTAISTITSIAMLDSYTPTGSETESWPADANDDGSIMCYVNGTDLVIAGNGGGKIMANEDSARLFYQFKKVSSISGMELLDTSNVIRMNEMFYLCSSLTTLDLSNFDTSNVTSMFGMFGCTRGLTYLNISSFNTSNVTDMRWMFLKVASIVELDLSHFDTSNVTNMAEMFRECYNCASIDLSSFDTSNVTDMSHMFDSVSIVELDLSHFDTSNVTNMAYMFRGCDISTTIDLSSFDTSNVTDMSMMFHKCPSLTAIYVDSGWDTSNATTTDMFTNCGVSSVTHVHSSDPYTVLDYIESTVG